MSRRKKDLRPTTTPSAVALRADDGMPSPAVSTTPELVLVHPEGRPASFDRANVVLHKGIYALTDGHLTPQESLVEDLLCIGAALDAADIPCLLVRDDDGRPIIAVDRARRDLDDRTAPMAGLVAAFVFAVQMLNFPVLPGVSGHLLGGALCAILVGPYVGALCVPIVLLLQALLFADGGLSALGTNITNMALVGVFTGYAVAYALRRVAARSRRGLIVTAFVAALVNTVVAALAFVVEYAIGGSGGAGLGTVFALMVGLHVLVGIGEGIITAATVGAVAATRPDLVYLLRSTRPAVGEGVTR